MIYYLTFFALVSCAWWVGGCALSLFNTREDVRPGFILNPVVSVTNMNALAPIDITIANYMQDEGSDQKSAPPPAPPADWCMIILSGVQNQVTR